MHDYELNDVSNVMGWHCNVRRFKSTIVPVLLKQGMEIRRTEACWPTSTSMSWDPPAVGAADTCTHNVQT